MICHLKMRFPFLAPFLAATLSAPLTAQAGGDLVNNGGGIGEQNVAYAWMQMPKALEACTRSTECAQRDTALLVQILAIRARMGVDSLRFASARQNPARFPVEEDGKSGFAVVEKNAAGILFWINLDRINEPDTAGHEQAISTSESMQILGELLIVTNATQGTSSPATIDIRLAERLAALVNDHLQVLDLEILNRPELRLIYAPLLPSKSTLDLADALSVDDGSRIFSLSGVDICKIYDPHLSSSGGTRLSKPYWKNGTVWSVELQAELLFVRANLSTSCIDLSGTSQNGVQATVEWTLPMQVSNAQGLIVSDPTHPWRNDRNLNLRLLRNSVNVKAFDVGLR